MNTYSQKIAERLIDSSNRHRYDIIMANFPLVDHEKPIDRYDEFVAATSFLDNLDDIFKAFSYLASSRAVIMVRASDIRIGDIKMSHLPQTPTSIVAISNYTGVSSERFKGMGYGVYSVILDEQADFFEIPYDVLIKMGRKFVATWFFQAGNGDIVPIGFVSHDDFATPPQMAGNSFVFGKASLKPMHLIFEIEGFPKRTLRPNSNYGLNHIIARYIKNSNWIVVDEMCRSFDFDGYNLPESDFLLTNSPENPLFKNIREFWLREDNDLTMFDVIG